MSCVGGGNFEVDPRTSETSYRDVSRGMLDSKAEYFGSSWLNPHLATYGNNHVGFICSNCNTYHNCHCLCSEYLFEEILTANLRLSPTPSRPYQQDCRQESGDSNSEDEVWEKPEQP